jgi:hypothetical protein
MRDWRLFGLPATGSTGELATRAWSSAVVTSPGASADPNSPFSQSSKSESAESRVGPSKLTSTPAAGAVKRRVLERASKEMSPVRPRMSSVAATVWVEW